ncbi:MAG: hypothetical protein MI725_01320 [Pirellulales bacterium]|nr:hypothetical protein [Pirellulales bacterium]
MGSIAQVQGFAKESASSAALGATTSRAAKQEAIRAIPLQRIPRNARRAVHQVITDSSLFRRMPTGIIACQPDLFTFLMQHPEVLVEMWKDLGISRVDLWRVDENTFQLSDNAGTTARLTIVEQKCEPGAQNRIVMYAEGAYEGKPFKKPVRAQCVLLLRSGSFKETNGKDYVAARLDTFVRVDRTSIKLFAKALHPLVGKTADANFLDTLKFVGNLSETAERNPARIEQLVTRLPRIPPQVEQEMLRLTYQSAGVIPKKRTRTARIARIED